MKENESVVLRKHTETLTHSKALLFLRTRSRNLEVVLKEDRERLKLLQKLQPRFTEGQKQELQEVHPWVRAGGLPSAMDVTVSSLTGLWGSERPASPRGRARHSACHCPLNGA